jgi:purine-cytosine permease-like protein
MSILWPLHISIFVELLSAGLMTVISGNDAFQSAYNAAGVGGFDGRGLQRILFWRDRLWEVYRSSSQILISMVLSLVSHTATLLISLDRALEIINIYSALNVQVIGLGLLSVPRLVWSLLGGAMFLAAAVAGRNHLSSLRYKFFSVISYWLTPSQTILFLEHIIWQRRYAYNISA